MTRSRLPRVLRRAFGLVRFAREAVGASAASLFLLDESGRFLTGLPGEWDWTRTSFASEVDRWPSVARALASGTPVVIDADDARGAESDWFEGRGIQRAMCLPLRRGGESSGVLFVDFDLDADVAPLVEADIALLVDVARRCVRAFARDDVSAPTLAPTWLS